MKWEIMKRFSAENRSCFSYKDVIREYPDKDHSYLSKVLAAMVRRGMLMKLSRDVYHIIPLSADPKTYSPGSRLVAKQMMKGKDYYIAYSAALITYSSQGCPDDENRKGHQTPEAHNQIQDPEKLPRLIPV